LLELVISAPIVYAIRLLVEPTFEAYSILRIEPTKTDIFAPIGHDHAETRSVVSYLQTQANLLTSDRVLNAAIADSGVVGLPVIKKWDDPKTKLRENLSVEIVDDAYLIRVALELADGDQAATIVNSVVNHYQEYNTDYNRNRNSTLSKDLKEQLEKIKTEIETKKGELHNLYVKGTVDPPKPKINPNALKEGDPAQPTLETLTEVLVQRMAAEIVETDLERAQTLAALRVLEEKAANQANGQDNTPELEQGDSQLEKRILDEFQKDPEVIALKEAILEMRNERDHTRSMARQPNDPSRRAPARELVKLEADYDKLWTVKHEQIRERLATAVGGPQSTNALEDLRIKLKMLDQKKQNQAQLYANVQKEHKAANHDAFEAAFLDAQVKALMNRQQQIEANLDQLDFDRRQDLFRVGSVDPATAPQTATNNKHIKYMLAAPVGVLFMILGLFMLLEIRAERIDDPDTLSNRVRSEVYALPPVPTTRSMRRLSAPQADDQIEQFIQRLDHLRFAVCGNSADLGKGRCVLITSAIGGEGKTTLAAQLAGRCGDAGMSTLLIDADLRRAALCPLLEVPEGIGLSDVLKDLATVDEVIIPVQGGTFYLLPAGTPNPDTSRVLQNQSFGLLITRLRQQYDLIVIDSPPVLPVPDALILGRWADGAVLAARYDKSRFPQVERARRQLDNAGIAILGTVINGMRNSAAYYGRYSYSRRRPSQPNSSNTI
jgi:capsular exopolysaccharide synthesis family protein